MPTIKHTITVQEERRRRVRKKLHGTAARPRVTIKRSNKNIYIQAIDDAAGVTIASANDVAIRKDATPGTKKETAVQATVEFVKALKKKKISAVIFDRGEYKYHGRVSSVAETLRAKGIEV